MRNTRERASEREKYIYIYIERERERKRERIQETQIQAIMIVGRFRNQVDTLAALTILSRYSVSIRQTQLLHSIDSLITVVTV